MSYTRMTLVMRQNRRERFWSGRRKPPREYAVFEGEYQDDTSSVGHSIWRRSFACLFSQDHNARNHFKSPTSEEVGSFILKHNELLDLPSPTNKSIIGQ